MTAVAGFLTGMVVGSLPTADLLARVWGVDLRTGGTGNPGANNALRLGGRKLATAVVTVEFAKGALAVWLGRQLGEDAGGALAAVGATVGNVYNPWFRFRGGKGLAITGGILAAAWPPAVAALGVVIAASLAAFRRSGPATLLTLTVYVAGAVVGLVVDFPVGWGISSPKWLAIMAIGSTAIMTPKHVIDTLRPIAPGASRRAP
jgi:glycerol-3-phosphate acyltransferase PlsY